MDSTETHSDSYSLPSPKQPCLDNETTGYSDSETSDDYIIFPSSDSSDESDMIFHSDESCDDEPNYQEDMQASVISQTRSKESCKDELLQEIAQVLVSSCCKAQCVRQLSVNKVFIECMGMVHQWQWITDKLIENSSSGANGELITTYLVAGKSVCKTHFFQCQTNYILYFRVLPIRKSCLEKCDRHDILFPYLFPFTIYFWWQPPFL